MCTLALAWQVFEDAPVVVAANRDESLGRPAEPPAARDWEAAVVAPKDTEAEGTWLGYNEHGLLVAITNKWTDRDIAGDRSRGLLVRDALAYERAEDAARYVERELDERSYDGFNIVLADETAAVLIEWDGQRRQVMNLEPDVHVIVNVGANGRFTVPDGYQEPGEKQAENASAVLTALQPEPGEDSSGWLDRARDVLGDHEYGVCIHRDSFGTRSSSLIAMRDDAVTYEYADGPPCQTGYERVTDTV